MHVDKKVYTLSSLLPPPSNPLKIRYRCSSAAEALKSAGIGLTLSNGITKVFYTKIMQSWCPKKKKKKKKKKGGGGGGGKKKEEEKEKHFKSFDQTGFLGSVRSSSISSSLTAAGTSHKVSSERRHIIIMPYVIPFPLLIFHSKWRHVTHMKSPDFIKDRIIYLYLHLATEPVTKGGNSPCPSCLGAECAILV